MVLKWSGLSDDQQAVVKGRALGDFKLRALPMWKPSSLSITWRTLMSMPMVLTQIRRWRLLRFLQLPGRRNELNYPNCSDLVVSLKPRKPRGRSESRWRNSRREPNAIDAAELDTGLENVASLVIPHRPILPQPSQQASKAKNVEPAM